MKHTLKKILRQISNQEVSNNRDLSAFASQVPLLSFNPVRFGIIFALAVLGAVVVFRERTPARVVVWMIVLYVVATSLFFFSSRFRLPLVPFYAVLAGIGLWHVLKPGENRTKGSLVLPVLMALVALAASMVPSVSGTNKLSSQYLTSRGHYFYATGELDSALVYHLQALEIDSTFPENNMNVGVVYFRIGAADSARSYLDCETDLHPRRHKAYTNLASLALVSGHADSALTYVHEALRRAPYDVTANALYLRCLLQLGSGFVDSLPVAIETAAKAADSNVYLFSDFGIILSNAGKLGLARQALMIAAGSNPPPIETNDNAFRPGFAESDRQWTTAKGTVFSQLCYLSGTTERYRDAINFGTEAVKHDPNLVDGYINLASAFMAVNRRNQADSVASLGLEKFPDDKTLQRLKHYAR